MAGPPRRWPVFLIASPAAVAVWSGWVGLGGLCGFGVIHPLPGIWDGARLNTAITLPIGVEAYGAYALGAWLRPGTSGQARTFARRSAIGALVLGMAGQVIYHLLAAAHAARAPWPVVMLVACLPVVTLGLGAALTHLLHAASGPAVQMAGGEPEWAGMDRAEIVAELASEIRVAMWAGDRWAPDYDALMDRTGFRRSWCEKAVKDARAQAFADAVPAPADQAEEVPA